ncbi:C40 family peptidase [Bacillus tianshenii]|nr:C40 family peptidase [Bacillus tianshenii]
MRCKKILVKLLAVFVTIFTLAPNAFAAGNTESLLQNAQALKGTPYATGGSSTNGFDCSGYTQYVFNKEGIKIPRTSSSQYSAGKKVSKSSLIEGDLVFFNTSGNGISHVGIYIGEGKFIHSATSYGVKVSSINDPYYWGSRYVGARRVLSEEKQTEQPVETIASSVQAVAVEQ